MSDTKCDCWEKMDKLLGERGLLLARGLSALSLGSDIAVVRGLSLERLDGAKIKRSDAKTLRMSHCPFCGTEYGGAKK